VVVVQAPPVHEVARLGKRVEDLRRQQLVAQPAVEALHDAVLPLRTGVDVERARAARLASGVHPASKSRSTLVASGNCGTNMAG